MDLTLRKLSKTEKKRLKEFLQKNGDTLLRGNEEEFNSYEKAADLARFNGIKPEVYVRWTYSN